MSTGPEPKEEIILSIAGGSGIAVDMVHECRYKYFLKNVMKWGVRRMKKHFAFGIVMHDIAIFQKPRDLFRKVWERGTISNDKPDEPKQMRIDREEDDIEDDILLANNMLDVWDEEEIVMTNKEDFFQNLIINPEDGKSPPELAAFRAAGRVDYMEHLSGEEILSDLKTSSAKWAKDRAVAEIGLPWYRYLKACRGDKEVNKGSYHVLTKTKNPNFTRHNVTMGPNDHFAMYDMFKRAAELIMECLANGHWPKCPKSCVGMYGGICDFHPLCFPERYNDPEFEVNKKLICRR